VDSTKLLNDYKSRRKETLDIVSKKIDSDLESFKSNMPFGTKIFVETEHTLTNSKYRDEIVSANCHVDFIRHLKETFSGETAIPVIQNNFALNVIQDIGTAGGRFTEGVESTVTVKTNLVDFPTLLVDMVEKPSAKTSDFVFLEAETFPKLCEQASDVDGFYSFFQTERNDVLLDNIKTLIDDSFEVLTTSVANPGLDVDILTSFYEQSLKPNYHEVLAYKVEKVGGAPTGDNREDGVLQNFWFFNKSQDFEYFDSQVRYGTEYTYNVYAYVLVEGIKYKASELRTTRKLDQESYTNLATGDSLGQKYCLEFYDPYTGETKEQLY
jgi:hypothetical protein